MKKLIFFFGFALSLNFIHAQEATGVNVVVTVENVLSDGGEISRTSYGQHFYEKRRN